MDAQDQDALDRHLERLEKRLPNAFAKIVRWVREPSSRPARLAIGGGLMAGGLLGFLPILGFWMLPLGLAVIAMDVPVLRPPMVKLLDWFERKWPAKEPVREG